MHSFQTGSTQAQLTAPNALGKRDQALAQANGKLGAHRVAVGDLDRQTIADMWAVFRSYYADISRDRFLSDLSEKQFVILLRDKGDQSLQGFSTIQVLRRSFEGQPYIAVYSGDTIINQAYWGQTALQGAFYRFLMGLMLRNPLTPLYWFLISKGYKTYLLVSRGCPDHWPRHDQATPNRVLGMIDQLATEKFGSDWKPEKGVLQFEKPAGRLKEGVAPIDDKALQHADIRFFAQSNPGHEKGDELCCLAAINMKLGVFYVNKLIKKTIRRQIKKIKG